MAGNNLLLLEKIPNTTRFIRDIERTIWRYEEALEHNLPVSFVKIHLIDYLSFENTNVARCIYEIAMKKTVEKGGVEILASAAANYFLLFNRLEEWQEYYDQDNVEKQKKIVEEVKKISYKLEWFNGWLSKEIEALKARDDFLKI